jgi:hypothetical protein
VREPLVAGEEHPGHRDHHRDARDQHRTAGRRRGRLERSFRTSSRRAFFTLALEVEERVVDAHREPDEQDHGGDVRVHRDQVARQCQQADRREHRRQCQKERDARRDDRAEHQHQDQERQWYRPLTGTCELRVEQLVERLARGDRAGLGDVEVGVLRLDAVGCLDDRVDDLLRLFVGAFHRELDERRVAVVRDLRAVPRVEGRLQVREDRAVRLHRHDRVLNDALERRVVEGAGLALNQDELGLRVDLESRVEQHLVGAVGLADVRIVLVDLLRPDERADRDREDDERKPPEDRLLAVGCAPATHPGRNVVRALQG